MAKLKFAKAKKEEKSEEIKSSYKVVIIDDDKHVHEITAIAFNAMECNLIKLEVLHAYSSLEAKEIFAQHNDIALALVDVVMETQEAGLELVNYIRNDLKNNLVRLIIRTGQANEFPEIEVIRNYDINDFKNKTELTMEKLFSTVRNSIKQYIQLVELQTKYETTYKQMTTHSLTKLSNRTKLYEDCIKSDDKILILIDIVNFSAINENYGYETGDFVLKELSGFLFSMYGDDFNIYHLDNDLFALSTVSKNIENIPQTVSKIKSDISRLQLITNTFNQTLNTTIGVALESETNLMRKAELALKEARSMGKNKIKYYSDDLKIIQRLENANHWGPIVKNGLIDGNIIAYYQPIYDIQKNTIEKYELLVRLKQDNQIYPPAKFLDAVFQTGQMYEIFMFMFDTACMQASLTGYKFSVNIGDSEFENSDIISFIKDTLKKYSIKAELISLEILEYNSIDEDSTVKEKIKEIHDLGIKIVIDDFGVNCSNFGQIQNLPIDIIKIDGSFIKNLPTSKNSQIIVKTIQTFAKEKEIELVAEFICDENVLESVKELNIKYGQGFYLGKPSQSL